MRKKKHEEHANHEAWAIPYADLMTLLLAFFVVMYAVSVVNEGKFRVMSNSINEAFNGSSHVIAPLGPTNVAPHSLAPPLSQSGTLGKALLAPINAPIAMIHPPTPSAHAADNARPGLAKSAAPIATTSLDHIETLVRRALQPLVDKSWVAVRRKPDWLEIEIRTDILFPSGVAQLSTTSDRVLQNLAIILAPFTNPLRVEGFTDNVPISTALYPSNWELSAARAASVARLFASDGVNQDRLGIVGWGQVRPIADNATIDGRNRNRRVLVVVMSDVPTPPRAQSIADQVADAPGITTAPPASALPTERVIGPLPQDPPAVLLPPRATVARAAPGLPVVPIIVMTSAAPPAAPATGRAKTVEPSALTHSASPTLGATTAASSIP